jgi:hypothetical protein
MRENCQGVQTSRKFFRQYPVNHPVPFDSGFPCESRCANMDTEVGFPSRPTSRVARMLAALVDDLKLARRELFLQLCGNPLTSHAKLHFVAHGFVNSLKSHYLSVNAYSYCGICIPRS